MGALRHSSSVGVRLILALGVIGLLALLWGIVTATSGRADSSLPLSVNAAAIVRVGDGITSVYSITPGSLVTVPVQVFDAVNLGSATVELLYDPAVVRPFGCTRPGGSPFDGGACNLAYAENAIRFNVVATQGFSGTTVMVEIGFLALSDAGGARSELQPVVQHFAGLGGNDLPVHIAGGAIQLAGAPPPSLVLLRVGTAAQQTYTVTPGLNTELPLTLQISDTTRLAAASVLLRYAPAVVRPTGCRVSGDVQGYCNYNFDPAAGLIKFALLSEAGLTGAAQPFSVTFEAVSGIAAGESALILTVEELSDPAAAGLTWQAVNGLIRVAGPAAASALVSVGAASGIYTVTHGLTQTVGIWVHDAADLGAATLALRFDPTVLQATSCAVRNDHDLSGGCAILADQVRASLIASAGLTGTQRLGHVTYTPVGDALVGPSSWLSLTVESFVDTASRPLTSRVRNGLVTIAPGGGVALLLVRAGSSADGGVYELPLAGSQDVRINVEGAGEIGAASVSIGYDPAVARAVTCSSSPTYGGGFCNPAAGAGLVRLGVVSGVPFTETTTLGTITFQPADGAAAWDSTPITVTVGDLLGPMSQALTYQVAPGWLTIMADAAQEPRAILQSGEGVYVVNIGGLATVGISATLTTSDTHHGLAAATLTLHYDPVYIRPARCTLRNHLWGGACNLSYAPDQIRLSVLSAVGLTGTVGIADVVFRGIGLPGEPVTVPLTLDVSSLVDVSAEPLTYRVLSSIIWVTGRDNDSDGVSDEIEAGAPNGGDGNYDGIPDAEQLNVTSLPNAVNGAYVTLAGPPDVVLDDVHVALPPDVAPDPSLIPPGAVFPLGLFQFKIKSVVPGGAVTLTLFVPPDAGIDTIYKFSPEPDQAAPHWYRFDFDGSTGCHAFGSYLTITYIDGGRGDADLAINGVIEDPLMPANAGFEILPTPTPTATPTA
ncbi:MAG: hypothetical protein QG637_714, partial [Chloroflexota bacterium]|nr:hypothetical protein [Chloroflexota bacterium]